MLSSTTRPFEYRAGDQRLPKLVLLVPVAILVLASSYLISREEWWGLVALLAACGLMLLSTRPFLAFVLLFAFLPFQGLLTDRFASQTLWVAVFKDFLAAWTLAVVLLRSTALRFRRHSGWRRH